MKKGDRKFSQEQENEIIQLYQSGLSLSQVSLLKNLKTDQIKYIVKKNSIQSHNKYTLKDIYLNPDDSKDQIIEDYLINQIPTKNILEKYNITQKQFYLFRQRHNIKHQNTNVGTKNPMFGKTVYSTWVEKYGKEIADQKLIEFKTKQSKNSSGKNNPMYGVPSPNGSGVGWKGWYKGFYFRSLREVSYLIFLDKNNIPWAPAEKKKYTIPYINWDGAERTYRPDFLINNDTLIEIKPKRLQKSPNVMVKTKAALLWAAENGLKYEIIDFPINPTDILAQIDTNIKFDRDYKERFLEYIKFI
jgi:hypothetical protein